MIVEALFNLIFTLFEFLFSGVSLPSLPPEAFEVFSSAVGYIGAGVAVLSNYVHLSYLLMLFGLILLIDIAMLSYKLVLFVLRKFPVLGVS